MSRLRKGGRAWEEYLPVPIDHIRALNSIRCGGQRERERGARWLILQQLLLNQCGFSYAPSALHGEASSSKSERECRRLSSPQLHLVSWVRGGAKTEFFSSEEEECERDCARHCAVEECNSADCVPRGMSALSVTPLLSVSDGQLRAVTSP